MRFSPINKTACALMACAIVAGAALAGIVSSDNDDHALHKTELRLNGERITVDCTTSNQANSGGVKIYVVHV